MWTFFFGLSYCWEGKYFSFSSKLPSVGNTIAVEVLSPSKVFEKLLVDYCGFQHVFFIFWHCSRVGYKRTLEFSSWTLLLWIFIIYWGWSFVYILPFKMLIRDCFNNQLRVIKFCLVGFAVSFFAYLFISIILFNGQFHFLLLLDSNVKFKENDSNMIRETKRWF